MSLFRNYCEGACVVIALLSTLLCYGCGSDDAGSKPAGVGETSTKTAPSEPAKSSPAESASEADEIDPLDRMFQELYDKVDFDGLASLHENEQTVYLVLRLRYEVLQGGLEYFFFNLAGEHARETVTALEKIGMAEAAATLERACALFPDDIPAVGVDDRQKQLDGFTDEERRVLVELGTTLTRSLEIAGEKIEYYLKTYAVDPKTPDAAIE